MELCIFELFSEMIDFRFRLWSGRFRFRWPVLPNQTVFFALEFSCVIRRCSLVFYAGRTSWIWIDNSNKVQLSFKRVKSKLILDFFIFIEDQLNGVTNRAHVWVNLMLQKKHKVMNLGKPSPTLVFYVSSINCCKILSWTVMQSLKPNAFCSIHRRTQADGLCFPPVMHLLICIQKLLSYSQH